MVRGDEMNTLAYLLLGILTEGSYPYIQVEPGISGRSADSCLAFCQELGFKTKIERIQHALDALVETGMVKAVPTSRATYYCFCLPE